MNNCIFIVSTFSVSVWSFSGVRTLPYGACGWINAQKTSVEFSSLTFISPESVIQFPQHLAWAEVSLQILEVQILKSNASLLFHFLAPSQLSEFFFFLSPGWLLIMPESDECIPDAEVTIIWPESESECVWRRMRNWHVSEVLWPVLFVLFWTSDIGHMWQTSGY